MPCPGGTSSWYASSTDPSLFGTGASMIDNPSFGSAYSSPLTVAAPKSCGAKPLIAANVSVASRLADVPTVRVRHPRGHQSKGDHNYNTLPARPVLMGFSLPRSTDHKRQPCRRQRTLM